ncbi:primase-helicase family protein [Aliarcobacter skirrowii]|uniref:primase-helicase family protein n=1 Tax=Aliarcobacter skirrowii TaxID=28200 RepID=UPI0008295B72|nr:primase-helicase family protein [Aliarcobacter skirrowii]
MNKIYSFCHNNWIKDNSNKLLRTLDKNGISMYLGVKGEIYYRLSPTEKYESTKDFKSLENIFKNITGEDIDLSAFYKKEKVLTIENGLEEKLKISPEDLKLVIAEVFNPFNNDEFILQDNYTYKLNNFKPSVYMLLDYELKKELKFHLENSAIGKLILHLVNYDRQRLYWVINWLAYFFQGLKKSQVALVLLGEQGAGKGILFNEVIKPLFGEDFVKTINDKSLNTNYKGSLVEKTLFFNLDEISAKNSSSSVKNFLKALVTNASITAEKKFKNLEKEIPIYGQILITSNELYALEIEPSDRRFTVFSTGVNLSHCNFLGYGNYEVLSNAIKNELESFAIYLKNYPIDEKIANTALNTPEKYNLIQQYQMTNYKPIKLTKLQKNVFEFSEAIRCRNLNLFNTIVDENKFQLKNEIIFDLHNGIFRVENLLPAFKTLYGSRNFNTNSELLRELQNFNINLFSINNIEGFEIDGLEKKCFKVGNFY